MNTANVQVMVPISSHEGLAFRLPRMKTLIFPGGEPHVEIEHREGVESNNVIIDARVSSMDDFMLALAITDAVRRCNPASMHLLIPYFPGARQDREEPGFALTAQVFADIINRQVYDSVHVLDPHSSVVPALIDRCSIIPLAPLVREFVGDTPDGIICPDAGAERRAADIAAELGCSQIVFARKKRDPRTGRLFGFSMDPLPAVGSYLVVDDICDGGGTFLGLAAEYAKDPNGTGPLSLWVSHGIFSRGFDEMSGSFNRIGCSDSWSRSYTDWPKVINILDTIPFQLRDFQCRR